MKNEKHNRILFVSLLAVVIFITSVFTASAARTDGLWKTVGSYMKTIFPLGKNILINGSNKYLNFNATSGSSGYGFRDSSGTIQYKNSGGSWAGVGTGGSGSTLHIDGGGFVYPQTGDYHSAPHYVATSTTATSTFPNIDTTQILISGDYITDFTGTNLSVTGGVLNASGGDSFSWDTKSWGVSTSTTLGFLNGFLSTASSTISGVLQATGGIVGDLTGNADTATALNANGANCSAGNYPLGVDASGAVESCTADSDTTYLGGTNLTLAGTTFNVDDAFLVNDANDTTTGQLTALNFVGSSITATSTFGWGIEANLLNILSTTATSTFANGIKLTGGCFELTDGTCAGAGGGGGTVTSVDMSVPTGLTISGNPITTSGTLALGLDTDYVIPLTASTTEWDTAYDWGDHSLAGYNLQTYASSTYVWASDWTTIDNYPTACTNQFVRGLGDTLTCATVSVANDTDLSVSSPITITTNTIGFDFSTANDWTGLNTFLNASSTMFSAYSAYFGATATSTFASDGSLSLSSALTVANGGTGATSLTDGGLLLGSGTGAITALGVASNGQIPIGDGTTDPVLATLTATAGEIEITNGAGSITIGIVASPTLDGTNFTGIPAGAFNAASIDGDDINSNIAGNSLTLTAGSPDTLDVDDDFLLNTGDIGTGVYDFGGATSFELPNGTPTVDTAGEIGIDTTSDQLIYYGTAKRVALDEFDKSLALASSTLAYIGSYGAAGTTTMTVWYPENAVTITSIYASMDTGTTTIRFGDGTNWSDTQTCGADVPCDDSSLANNTFTARETFQVQIGQLVGDPNLITITLTGEETAN